MAEPAPRLSQHTTLRLGGPADHWVEATDEATLVRAAADPAALLVAGGSNLVVADEGVRGTVVKVATRGVEVLEESPSTVLVRVAAGESWDELVGAAVERGWVGIEALSGIPGAVGSTPIQNVGAYGQEVSQTILSVRAWDRREQRHETFDNAACGFGYRSSRFKTEPGRYVVLTVDFEFSRGTLGTPVRYGELARTLGVEAGQPAPMADVRATVLKLRAGKGMVLDAEDHDTWSAGSFFTNPFLTAEQSAALPAEAPRFEQPDGTVKSSAAWLIDHAGFGRGFALPGSRVALSGKHTLALTNRGGATTGELLELARTVRDGVEDAYGVRLVNEPVLVGCEL